MWVYKISNDINDKLYIGQSKYPVKHRFQRHKQECKNLDTHFARALKKYGFEHFKIEVVEEGIEDPELLTQREMYWIHYYDSIKNGYNETDSGFRSGGNTYKSKTSEEMQIIKDKLKQSKLGGKNPRARAIKMINVQTKEEKKFESMSVCAEFLGLKDKLPISKRCRGQIIKPLNGVYDFKYIDN